MSDPPAAERGAQPIPDIWQPAYIALGSNLEDPRVQVLRAVAALRELPQSRFVVLSPLYESRPFGPIEQPDFVNAVAGLLTLLEPEVLLSHLQRIERRFGRPVEHPKWGPRIIDLDLLAHGRQARASPQLTLPHPGIEERNFVLYPLSDIAPGLELPGLGRVSELKARIGPQGLKQAGVRTAG